LEGHLWDLVEEVFKDEMERGLMFDEIVYLLKEQHNDVNEDQTAQG
jgi:hypothetical protein